MKWRLAVVVNMLCLIKEVNRRWARLVLRWVTVRVYTVLVLVCIDVINVFLRFLFRSRFYVF